MKKVAVLLSGCGVYDGAEIHESVLSLFSLAKHGFDYTIFAPNKTQTQVINHLNGDQMNESRNVLVEAARIARGDIQPLDMMDVDEFDALFIPGGFGVAKNFCSFAFDGNDMNVDSTIETTIKAFNENHKLIVALCISPVLIAKILVNTTLTIGDDEDTAAAIESFGSKHKQTEFTGIVNDDSNKIITAPCYMLDSSIVQIAENIENVVKEMVKVL